MRETTRAIEVHAEGEIRGYSETTRDMLLPRVPVPAPEGEREVQPTPDATPEPENVRGDDEAPKEGACVGARDARMCPDDGASPLECEFVPGVFDIRDPHSPRHVRVLYCKARGAGLKGGVPECPECVVGKYGAEILRLFGTPISIIRPAR
jgi:hypothetical protein